MENFSDDKGREQKHSFRPIFNTSVGWKPNFRHGDR